MYDTISILLSEKDLKQLKNIADIRCEINYRTGEELIKGYFKNFAINQGKYRNNFYLSGSFPKFYFGSNLETMTRQATQRTIEKLADETGLKISEHKVTRLDIATNFFMNNPIQNYLTCFGELNHFKKSNYKETLYYSNCNKKICFYDKLKELKKKKILYPDGYNKFIGKFLRYESRFIGRLSKQFKMFSILAKDLYNHNFYITTLHKWQELYFNIIKIPKLIFNEITLNNIKTFQNQLMLLGLKQLGFNEALEMIELSRPHHTRLQVSRIKKKIRNLMSIKELTEKNEAILELDNKVRQAVIHYST